jgi:DnaK suppressor protein
MLTAGDAMQTDVESVSPGTGLVDLERKFVMLGLSGFPVVEKGQLVGIVSRSDVVRILAVERSAAEQQADFYRSFEDPARASSAAAEASAVSARVGQRAGSLKVRDAMVRRVIGVERDQPLAEVAQLMLDGHIHRLPVLDEGKLVGLVTTIDLIRLFAEGRIAEASSDAAFHQQLLAAGSKPSERHDEARKLLEERLERLTQRTIAIEGDLRSEHDRDSEERAVERENDEVLERLEQSERVQIAQIRRALARIASDEYDTCEQCGAPVGLARQAALPAATRCLACS